MRFDGEFKPFNQFKWFKAARKREFLSIFQI